MDYPIITEDQIIEIEEYLKKETQKLLDLRDFLDDDSNFLLAINSFSMFTAAVEVIANLVLVSTKQIDEFPFPLNDESMTTICSLYKQIQEENLSLYDLCFGDEAFTALTDKTIGTARFEYFLSFINNLNK